MPLKYEGNNPRSGVPAAKCYKYTFGYQLANGKVTPCTAQGQVAEFVFGDTVDVKLNAAGMGMGFGVPLFSPKMSGGIAVPVLAGGVVTAGDDLIVDMVNFTIDGVVVSLPVAKAASDGVDGDSIVGFATRGYGATAADDDVDTPSLLIEFYETPKTIVGGETTDTFITMHIDLAAITGAGDAVTSFIPEVAGEIVSYQFLVTEPATTAAKAVTINLEINATDVTGGVLALTSDNVTPLGAVIAATAITANSTFDANDTISVEASAVTAFVEGEGDLIIRIRTAS